MVDGREACRNTMEASFNAALQQGVLIDSAGFQAACQQTPEAISEGVLAGRIFCVELDGVRAYPSFYLDSRYDRKQLEAVTKLLGDLSGASKLQFFSTPKGSLSLPDRLRTPLQAIEDGDIELVKRSALGFLQR